MNALRATAVRIDCERIGIKNTGGSDLRYLRISYKASTVNLPKRRSGLENFCTLFSSEDLSRTKIASGIRIRPQKR